MVLPALPRAPFELTPEQEEIRRLCRDFAANEIRPVSLAVDEADMANTPSIEVALGHAAPPA
jgi:hypothetical protein